MRHRRRLALALVSMAATAAGAAFGAPALAADGANGTVKIDGPEYQLDNRNEPHVTCGFQVEFFDLDAGERGTLIFEAQPPSSKDFHEVGRLEDQLLSKDPATGGAYTRDPDEVFKYPGDIELDLTKADLHKQGYHIKLTVDRDNYPNWTEKHKVFWLQPCEETESPSSPPPSSPENPPSSPETPPTSTPPTTGPTLPVTGAAATTIALTGVALVGGGAALMWFRRRRDNVTFES
ncbi:MAG TPA: LPXTG cell wall anchor domain-containing protein [Micromonosporaceae bacterium]